MKADLPGPEFIEVFGECRSRLPLLPLSCTNRLITQGVIPVTMTMLALVPGKPLRLDLLRVHRMDFGFRFRILCALREGPFGVAALNTVAEQILKEERLINPDRRWYPGRPVLITRNDYTLRLFNGDMGIVLSDPSVNNELRVFFKLQMVR